MAKNFDKPRSVSGYRTAEVLTARERSRNARTAANARWAGKTPEQRMAEYRKGRTRTGKPASCLCGECPKCRHREVVRRFRAQLAARKAVAA